MAQRWENGFVVTVVGATGAVGREFLQILEEREFPVRELRAVASSQSVGKTISFRGEDLPVRELKPESFGGSDLVFFSAGALVSREFAPIAARSGALVVDNTSAFRLDPDVPLAVPEVNPDVLAEIPRRRIIAVPNCSTVQLVVALAPIHRKARIRRMVVSTYQSASGAGKKAMDELSRQVADLYSYREPKVEAFPHRIAFNVIPQIGDFHDGGVTGEEAKIVAETKKILGDPTIGVSVTAVRVPTFHSHAESVNVETESEVTAELVRTWLSEAPGVEVVDDPKEGHYPMPVDVQGTDSVYVGRIRDDSSRKNCLNLWIVADNLRKGAALNGVQIFEFLRERNLLYSAAAE